MQVVVRKTLVFQEIQTLFQHEEKNYFAILLSFANVFVCTPQEFDDQI